MDSENFRVLTYVAQSYLFSKKRQTIIATLGVTFGISMFIVMINFMTGVNDFLASSAFEGTPDIRIFNRATKSENTLLHASKDSTDWIIDHGLSYASKHTTFSSEKIEKFLLNKKVVRDFSPQINTQAIFAYGSNQLAGSLTGVDPTSENKTYELEKRLILGTVQSLDYYSDGIIVGNSLYKKLNLKIGDYLQVTTINGRKVSLKVVGVFTFGISIIDNAKAYVNIRKVRKILDVQSNYVTDIHVKLFDHYNFADLTDQLNNDFTVETENWQQANKTIMAGIEVRNTLTWIVSFAMLLVAGFGIYNIMNISVINKYKDIAILKAVGFNKKDIVKIFLMQSVFIGLSGAILGMILGFFLCLAISFLPLDVGDFLSVTTYPMNFEIGYYILGAFFGIITTVVAGYLPAKKAGTVDPISILRGI